MNHNDQEHFWQTLCSLPGNDIAAEREQPFKSIKQENIATVHMDLIFIILHFALVAVA